MRNPLLFLCLLALPFSANSSVAALAEVSSETVSTQVTQCRQLIQKIDESIKGLQADPTKDPTIRHSPLLHIKQTLETQVLPKLSEGLWDQALRTLKQIRTDQVDLTLQPEWTTLLESVELAANSAKMEIKERFSVLESKLSRELLSYETPKQLDTAIYEVNEIREAVELIGRWESNERPKTSELLSILTSWQEFLFYKDQGEQSETMQRIRQLESRLGNYNLIPRSKILELRASAEPKSIENQTFKDLDEIIGQLDGPETYGRILGELNSLFNRSNRNHKVSAYRSMIESLVATQSYIEEKNPEEALYNIKRILMNGSYAKDPSIIRESNALTLKGLSCRLEAELQPKPDEPLSLYIDRVGRSLGEKDRWEELAKFITTIQDGQIYSSYRKFNTEQQACSSLLAGIRYESIGDYKSAYRFYSRVIGSTAIYNQPNAAKAGIQRIVQEHPQTIMEAKLEEEALKAYREQIEQANMHGGMPPHIISEQGFRKSVEDIAKEVLATSSQPRASTDPFSHGAGAIPKGNRFEVTYLNDQEDEITSIYERFEQEGQRHLRIIESPNSQPPFELPLDEVASLKVENPISKDTMNQWPSRFGSGIPVPRTQMTVLMNSGAIRKETIFSTYYFSFYNKDRSTLKIHPCRVLHVRRVE